MVVERHECLLQIRPIDIGWVTQPLYLRSVVLVTSSVDIYIVIQVGWNLFDNLKWSTPRMSSWSKLDLDLWCKH